MVIDQNQDPRYRSDGENQSYRNVHTHFVGKRGIEIMNNVQILYLTVTIHVTLQGFKHQGLHS